MMCNINKELKDEIERNVIDAYHYGTEDYRATINFSRGVEDYFDVDIEFIKHRIEIYVTANDRCETITLPYGKKGQTVLLERIYAAIDILASIVTNY